MRHDRKLVRRICFGFALLSLVSARPSHAQAGGGAQLALGAVVQYRVTPRDRSDPTFPDMVAALDTLESRFAKRFLSSQLFAYYDRQSLSAVQNELNTVDNFAFDQMSGPSKAMLKRLDYLAVFSSSLKGPPAIRVMDVETGRVFASEVCTGSLSVEPACIATVARQLLSSGSDALKQRRDRMTRQEQAKDDAAASAAAMDEVTPQYERMVSRASAEIGFWDRTRKQSRQGVLRPELETLLSTIQAEQKRCGDLVRQLRAAQVRSCVGAVNNNLDKLGEYK